MKSAINGMKDSVVTNLKILSVDGFGQILKKMSGFRFLMKVL